MKPARPVADRWPLDTRAMRKSAIELLVAGTPQLEVRCLIAAEMGCRHTDARLAGVIRQLADGLQRLATPGARRL
jgi:hypothetical protein